MICFFYGSGMEYAAMPRIAEIRIIMIGDGFFLNSFFDANGTAMSKRRIITAFQSIFTPPYSSFIPNSTLSAMVTAVARISATMHGRTPFRNACTPLYFKKPCIREAMIRIMMTVK